MAAEEKNMVETGEYRKNIRIGRKRTIKQCKKGKIVGKNHGGEKYACQGEDGGKNMRDITFKIFKTVVLKGGGQGDNKFSFLTLANIEGVPKSYFFTQCLK